ncbi:MAG: dTMP kinase [Candidatus Ryanbacteria bacterium RIFCSPHIGHO2_12_FULL_47_12b]|nr:MAG: dTMP kinase [Candidatus Ryanbacteria bacterium RIFCSPHIGHO2_12_FULL_47_12b]
MDKHATGKFIVFEGGECVGKTSQIKLLAERLRVFGHDVVVTKEPGGGGEEPRRIRELLLSGTLSPKEEIELFIKNRRLHVANLIRPSLEKGCIILCDRFSDSTFAYQCYARNLGIESAQLLDADARQGIAPDLVIVLDMPVERALERLSQRKGEVSAFDREKREFHERVRAGFRAVAKAFSHNHVVLNADASQESVATAVWGVIVERFPGIV